MKPKFCGKWRAPRTVTRRVFSFGECIILRPTSGSKLAVRSSGVVTLFSPLSRKLLIFAMAMSRQNYTYGWLTNVFTCRLVVTSGLSSVNYFVLIRRTLTIGSSVHPYLWRSTTKIWNDTFFLKKTWITVRTF